MYLLSLLIKLIHPCWMKVLKIKIIGFKNNFNDPKCLNGSVVTTNTKQADWPMLTSQILMGLPKCLLRIVAVDPCWFYSSLWQDSWVRTQEREHVLAASPLMLFLDFLFSGHLVSGLHHGWAVDRQDSVSWHRSYPFPLISPLADLQMLSVNCTMAPSQKMHDLVFLSAYLLMLI